MAHNKKEFDAKQAAKREAKWEDAWARLMYDGFGDEEIKVLQRTHLTPYDMKLREGGTRRTTAVYNLRRRRRRRVANWAIEHGLDPRDPDQFWDAAQSFREEVVHRETEAWKKSGMAGLPPDWDPLVELNYAQYA